MPGPASLTLRDIALRDAALRVALASTWPANTPFDARLLGDVEFQFTTGTVTVTRSLDGIQPYVNWPVLDSKGAYGSGTDSNIAGTPGIWSVDGSAYLTFSADVTVRGGF